MGDLVSHRWRCFPSSRVLHRFTFQHQHVIDIRLLGMHALRMLRVGARCVAPPRIRTFARGAASLSINDVDEIIANNKLAIFMKSYCSVCKDVCERFEDADVPFKQVALDAFENGNAIRDELRGRTRQEHVPFVFLDGKYVPSETVILGMKGSSTTPGAFKTALEAAGLRVAGYFRA